MKQASLGGSVLVVWLASATMGLFGWMTGARAQTITEYPLPTSINSYPTTPRGIVTGPDGALWFTLEGTINNKIGRITTAGAITAFPVPLPSGGADAIAAGPDGALWFTDLNGAIGRITTSGAITEYPVPRFDSGLGSITTGPDGALWFLYPGQGIGRITTSGSFSEFPISLDLAPEQGGITSGPDGALWFAGTEIGRITTSGTVTGFVTSGNVRGIATGPDGALWFAELAIPRKIGRITTSGAITEFPIPTGRASRGALQPGQTARCGSPIKSTK